MSEDYDIIIVLMTKDLIYIYDDVVENYYEYDADNAYIYLLPY